MLSIWDPNDADEKSLFSSDGIDAVTTLISSLI